MATAWLKNLKQKQSGQPIFASLLLFLLILPFSLSLRADFYQSNLFSASFSLRLRGELNHNFNLRRYGSGTSDNFLLYRARFEFTLTPISFLNFHVQIQDAEVLGSRFSDADFSEKNNPFHDPFDLNQLYLDFQPNQAFFLRAGRQSVSLGDNRVFGPGEWGNTGRYAWDALLTRFELNHLVTTILFGRPVNHDPDRWPNRKALAPTVFTIYSTLKLTGVDFDLFYISKYDGRGRVQGGIRPGKSKLELLRV